MPIITNIAYKLVSLVLRMLKWFERAVIARPAKRALDCELAEHAEMVTDLVDRPEVQYTKRVAHHKYHTRFDHMMLVSKFAYYFANKVGADVRTCVRAAAIHDVWTQGFYVQPAVDFAKRIGESKDVQAAIASHMVFNKLPKTKEQFVVSWSDEVAWGAETLEFLRINLQDILGWLAEVSPVNVK